MTLTEEAPRNPPRGRPSKREAVLLRGRVLHAALAEFRQHGYAGSSIEGIARVAGVSRTTIYALYTDKSTLFSEMIRSSIVATDLAGRVAFDDRDPAIVLGDAMKTLNGAYYREPNLEIIRMCIGEADRFPVLFEGVRLLLSTTLNGLVAYLARLRDAGMLAIEGDVEQAALLFNMLSLGTMKPFFISQDRLSPEDMAGHLDLALQIFLRGSLVTPGAPAANTDGTG